MTIGSIVYARALSEAHRNGWPSVHIVLDILGNGWSFVGSGAYRSVYKGPDGVCYKYTKGSANRDEISNYTFLLSLLTPESNVRFPKMRLFKSCGILAAEFIDGEEDKSAYEYPYENSDRIKKIQRFCNRTLGILDTHGGNIRFVGDVAYIIDIQA